MITKTTPFLAGALAFSAACAATSAAPTPVVMGDGKVNGALIKPYEYEWRQCTVQEGDWVNMGPLTESAVLIGDTILRVRQTSNQPSGTRSQADVYLDRKSLSPLRMEQNVYTADGAHVVSMAAELTDEGYAAEAMQGGEGKSREGVISTKMYHGGALGLPLATLDYDAAPFSMTASMMSMNATYETELILAGNEKVSFNGHEIELLLVDVKWVHNEIGDVYPPGPDASGGRYWIAQNPPDGFPYVPKYKTDTYAVDFIGDTCPE